ncbi:alpha-mannosidase [Paenibacillus sp.]|uniref:alpha-mannosidase n=1 Tax=Paenibacillus sp. TaxID=58172 RepID=UPI002812124A|nr:alpha-mannosidase [Paenibacillus sp.]
MLWTKEKLAARIHELEAFRYRGEKEATDMRMKEDPVGAVGSYPPEDGPWQEIQIGDRWVGRDKYVWLLYQTDIPAEWQGKRVLGRFDFGSTGGGGNSGFESLLFLNGRPYQGVDSYHQEVFLPAEPTGGKAVFHFRLWSGLNGYGKAAPIEHTIRRASLCWLDEATDDLYFTARALLDTVRVLDERQPERHELLSALDRAFLRIDWSAPGSDDFYASIEEARQLLRGALAKMSKHHAVHVQCIGHTHIDVAWLWRLKHTREKAARSFSTALRLLEQYPEYVFLQTQPQLYAYIKSDYPDIYEQIRERVREGRWEAGGAMWLEADCNLVSGESLVRQLLYGTRFFREEFGVECRYLWLPDVFGYSWALPQILLKSGIEAFMTTKISWNQYNRMPHDTFLWRGIDGSEILTHFITTPDPGAEEGAFYYTYNGAVTPQSVVGIWDAYRDKEINRELLLAYGYGDGGGGANREMLELRRRLEAMPGLPHVTPGRADAYFDRLKETVASTDRYVHTWNGELYLELHRGTYTSQAYNKRANRKLELRLRETEWISVLAGVQQGSMASYPKQELDRSWMILLRNQFHDIIPGSSIGEVYEDCRAEYAEAFGLADAAWSRSARALTARSAGTFTIFNSAPWERTDLVSIPVEAGMEDVVWRDGEGNPLPAQRNDGMWTIRVVDVPSMGVAAIHRSIRANDEGTTGIDPFARLPNGFRTPFYELEWNESGQLANLYDRIARRHVLAPGQAGNVLQVFEDKPKGRHEAWDIDIFYQEKMRVIDQAVSIQVVETGQVRAVIGMEWSYGSSRIRQRMILYADDRRIDFDTHVDWHEQRQLLKVAFPVSIHAHAATFDIQFGNVTRPTHWNTSWDYGRFESVGHQWADLSERDYGVSLLNDCKYGYDIKDNVLRLSLIKSAMVPDPHADQGEHRFVYALLPHVGDWVQGGTMQAAWHLNNPLAFLEGKPAAKGFSLLSVDGDHVFIDAVKKAEDGDDLFVRVHEYTGRRGWVTLCSDTVLAGWQETDLMERVSEPSCLREAPVRFFIEPYEIKTILLRVSADR